MSAQEFKKIILAELHGVLKPAGFRKKGTTFFANLDKVVLLIHLQSSRISTKELLIATINLGIFWELIALPVENTHSPSILEAHWRKRIGSFLPYPHNKWWRISSEKEAHRAAKEIAGIVSDKILPEMRRLGSERSLKALCEENGLAPGLTDYERSQCLRLLETTSTPKGS